jgi:hypothetical protein
VVGQDACLFWINLGTQGNGFADSAVMRLPKASFPVGPGQPADLTPFAQGQVGGDSIAQHDVTGPPPTLPLVYFISTSGDVMQMMK